MAVSITVDSRLLNNAKVDVVFNMTNNSVMQWVFFGVSENWRCTFTGSFRQACFVARRMYSQAYQTKHGELLLVDLREINKETAKKLSKIKQLPLDLKV